MFEQWDVYAHELAGNGDELAFSRPISRCRNTDTVFAGFDFAPFSKAVVQVEYDAKSLNADVRFYPTPWLSLDAGVVADDLALGLTLRSDW